jgi:hypothetical protein
VHELFEGFRDERLFAGEFRAAYGGVEAGGSEFLEGNECGMRAG